MRTLLLTSTLMLAWAGAAPALAQVAIGSTPVQHPGMMAGFPP